MTPVRPAPFVAASLLAALLALASTSCETLETFSGSGKSGAELARHKKELADSRTAMNRAAQEGDLHKIQTTLSAIGSQFNAIQSKSSAMNLMDRESMAIKMATGRRTITEASRWVQVSDADAVRSQVAHLDPILAEIDVLLDRAVKSSVPAAAGTQ